MQDPGWWRNGSQLWDLQQGSRGRPREAVRSCGDCKPVPHASTDGSVVDSSSFCPTLKNRIFCTHGNSSHRLVSQDFLRFSHFTEEVCTNEPFTSLCLPVSGTINEDVCKKNVNEGLKRFAVQHSPRKFKAKYFISFSCENRCCSVKKKRLNRKMIPD